MEIASKYNPAEVEDKWYKYWLDNGFFKSKPDDREPYTIVIPPPNVTGVLHMGHMLNNTIQDILVRRARMMGKNACWVPGTDHASIATEAKVVNKLAQEGIKKTDLSREDFLKHAWEWTDKHGGIILEQLKKLGASCDWDRTAFTMDDVRSESVIDVFIDLYNKGLIYRGVRMVNWDPKALTALSDEEVVYKEVHSKLYYLRYMIEGGEGKYIVVATTRPETILGDTAVCVNPNDPRFEFLKGKKVLVPIINRAVPIIMDDYVDMEFGTGCLKVTPAHDVNDYMLGEKYNLQTIDIFNDNGTLNQHGEMYAGMDRFDVREKIEKDLLAAGLMEKVEDYDNKVGYSERTDVPIEPKLSMQWFLKMTDLAKPALDAVMNDDIKLHPAKFKNTYRHWMENVKDWCISRQLWWGHRIPAYFLPEGGYVVASTVEEALKLAQEKTGNQSLTAEDLRQDSDCLDTWFSSWLWPMSVFGNVMDKNNEELNYYYPTNDLVTGPDILFFWVARMIIAGYEYKGDMPFRNVYLTGIVRDKLGRKMSKSLGNSPDPITLMEQYGADGVRMGLMMAAPAGNDVLFDDSLCEQGRNFNNKIWNAFRLVKGWTVDETIEQPEASATAIRWFQMQLAKTIAEVDDSFSKYRLSEAMMAVYKLFWDEFSSWYLELVKPGYQQPIDKQTYNATLGFFDDLLKLLHPFMPFITEELWQATNNRNDGESIMMQQMPQPGLIDHCLLELMEETKEITKKIREYFQRYNINYKLNDDIITIENKEDYETLTLIKPIIKKLCNLELKNWPSASAINPSFIVKNKIFFMNLGGCNYDAEITRLNEELVYLQGFRESVLKKLSNESFVGKAPAKVIEMERKKLADAESKINSLQESIAALK